MTEAERPVVAGREKPAMTGRGGRKAGGDGGKGRGGLPGMAAGCRRYKKISEKTTKYFKKTLALYAKICYNFARY